MQQRTASMLDRISIDTLHTLQVADGDVLLSGFNDAFED